MNAPLALGAEPGRRSHFLGLHLAVPAHRLARTDRRSVSAGPAAFAAGRLRRCGCRTLRPARAQTGSVASGHHCVAIHEQRPALIRHDDVEGAAIAEIRKRHGASVVGVGCPDDLRDICHPTGTVVHPDPLPLVPEKLRPLIDGQFFASPMIVLWPPAITPKSCQ